MGAGSAKGMQPEDDDEADRFSTTSSGKWANEDDSSDEGGSNNNKNNNKNLKKTIAEVSTSDPGPSGGLDPDGERNGALENGTGDTKRKFFNFKKGDDSDKADDLSDDNTDRKRKDAKKEGDKKTGFKLFGWRNKKATEEKDVELEKDIDDLEKTFDSLGIVGKNMWGDEPKTKPRKEAVDDLELLEPMRKRKNVRVRGTRGMNGTVAVGHETNASRSLGGDSSGSRRTFKYSWETEQENVTTKDEEDEWEYKAVVIEGFDIDKFRKANKRDAMFDSTSLPNAVSGDDYEAAIGAKSPLRYDHNEQQILASIERDYTFN